MNEAPFSFAPSHARTLPVGRRVMCTATSGQLNGPAHWPTPPGVGVFTVTDTAALVLMLLAASRARASRIWLPADELVVSQTIENGGNGTSAPNGVPSR